MPIVKPKASAGTGSIDTTAIDAAIKQLKDNVDGLPKPVSTGNSLPIDDKNCVLFLLKNHATLPNGVYFWDGLWVQV